MLKTLMIGFICSVTISKPYVFYVEKRMESLKTSIKKNKRELNLLKIEWVYLNQNGRLQNLAEKFLPHLKPLTARQLKSFK